MQLKSRIQRKEESVQEYALDIERLAQTVYGELPSKALDLQKIQAFIDGVGDVDIRRQMMVNPKGSFMETVEYALLLESASAACKSVYKLRQMESEGEEVASLVCKAVKTALGEGHSQTKNFKGKCYNCDKVGHMARDCRMRSKNNKKVEKPLGKEGEEEVIQSLNEEELDQ